MPAECGDLRDELEKDGELCLYVSLWLILLPAWASILDLGFCQSTLQVFS